MFRFFPFPKNFKILTFRTRDRGRGLTRIPSRDSDPLPLRQLALSSPLGYYRLVSLSLLIVAGLAQRLQVTLVKEPLDTTDWPWRDMICHLSSLDYALARADSAERMRGSERLAYSRPTCSMVEAGRLLSHISLLLSRSGSLAIPGELRHIESN